MRKERYFDHAAYTGMSRATRRSVISILDKETKGLFGNPNAPHEHGRRAERVITSARAVCAQALRVAADDCVVVASATEANMLALRTACAEKGGHIVLCEGSHDSVLRYAAHLRNLQVTYSIAEANAQGVVEVGTILNLVRENTVCVTTPYARGDSGVMQPVRTYGTQLHNLRASLLFHVDASQVAAYLPCGPHLLCADAVTLDGQKLFGPQGVALLAFAKRNRFPGLTGEHSQWDMRPGTPAMHLVHGMACAMAEGARMRERRATTVSSLRNFLTDTLQRNFPDCVIHGLHAVCAPHICRVSFPAVNHEYLSILLAEHGFAVGCTSACFYRTRSMALPDGIRLSLSPETRKRDIQALIRALICLLPIARCPEEHTCIEPS